MVGVFRMFIVVTKVYDSEYGNLAGFNDIKIVQTEAEAVTEVQKRHDVYVRKFSVPTISTDPRYTQYESVEKQLIRREAYLNRWGGPVLSVVVTNSSAYFPIREDGTFDGPNEDGESVSTEWGSWLLNVTPIYEQDPRGSAYNHKIIRYEFRKVEEVDTSDTI